MKDLMVFCTATAQAVAQEKSDVHLAPGVCMDLAPQWEIVK